MKTCAVCGIEFTPRNTRSRACKSHSAEYIKLSRKSSEYKAYQAAYRRLPASKDKKRTERNTPEYKAYQAGYLKKYRATERRTNRGEWPNEREYQKAYRQRPESKDAAKKRRSTPECKTRDREYKRRPDRLAISRLGDAVRRVKRMLDRESALIETAIVLAVSDAKRE